MKHNQVASAGLVIVALFLGGCGGGSSTMAYASKDGLIYLSKKVPPLRFEVPEQSWDISFPQTNKVFYQHRKDRERTLSLTYSSLKNAPYFKSTLTPKDLLEEYFRWEAEHYRTSDPNTKVEIVSRDIDGPAIPNILWYLEGKNGKFYSIAFIKDDKQITFLSHNIRLPNEGKDFIIDVFRSLRLLTDEQVDTITEKETSYKGRLSWEP